MDDLSPPPISFSAPELSSRCVMPFKALRNAVSSTQLLHERAMARFRKAVAMKEEQTKNKEETRPNHNTDIPYNSSHDNDTVTNKPDITKSPEEFIKARSPPILIKSDSNEDSEYKYNSRQTSQDSETSAHKWQHMSFDEDYTASTVSTDEEYSDDGSLNADLDRRSQYSNEDETYNPRDKLARPSPLKESAEELEEEEEESEHELLKPLPLPDPNFVPKPILKRREPEIAKTKQILDINISQANEKPKSPKLSEKSKKDDKLTIFKKITKMPGQKSFQFPKFVSKKEPVKVEETPDATVKTKNKTENVQDKVSEEGRTVIDYYTNIVKEYGSQKKSTTPTYLKTEELKAVAEQQQIKENNSIEKQNNAPESKQNNSVETKQNHTPENKSTKLKKPMNKAHNNKVATTKAKANSVDKSAKAKNEGVADKKQVVKKGPAANTTRPKTPELQNKTQKKYNQQQPTAQVILRKAERATIVIPINYQELEEKAKINVRSAIDYTVDICLLVLAFWVYFFKDERLAIPFLILIIYRQLQETVLQNIPEWFKRHTPSWLKIKTS